MMENKFWIKIKKLNIIEKGALIFFFIIIGWVFVIMFTIENWWNNDLSFKENFIKTWNDSPFEKFKTIKLQKPLKNHQQDGGKENEYS